MYNKIFHKTKFCFNLDQYDLNTVASLVKAFLRDLQNSVIPEEIYERLVCRIQTISTDELRSLIETNLEPTHLACLRFIMQHLIRVWNYQYKMRGCHYLPDKLFHIFRSILMRPAWTRIVEIVRNVDSQSLAMQRLMLECDWGVELPEYKVRPKRPASPVRAAIVRETSPVVSLVKNDRTITTEARQRRRSGNKESLADMHWYWGGIDRDETMLILKNCPDGSFVVRDSSDRSTNAGGSTAPYTLCVIKGWFCF